jgi:uracil-DNA glycosylase
VPRRFDRFIDDLSCVELSPRACNQFARIGGDVRGNAIRRRNLRLYLEELDAIGPRLLLVGEAVSYRGGRLTGIPFVSETVMLCGVDLANGSHVLGSERGYRKADLSTRISTEASATMVWGTIRDIEPLPLLWNAFPFHPFDAGNPLTNRMPTPAELEIGATFVIRLIRLFGIERVAAIGNQASFSLTRLGVPHQKVRHPSQGGKNLFVAGMARHSQFPRVEDSMPRKSQIQEIKEGVSTRTKTYPGRVQQAGPKPPMPTKNAVRLSTVPSSAKEKYKGGRD